MKASDVRATAIGLASEYITRKHQQLLGDIIMAETAGVSSIRWSFQRTNPQLIDSLKLLGYKLYKQQVAFGATLHIRWESNNPHSVPLPTLLFKKI